MSAADRLPTRDRLYVQMLNLSAASDDLRQFPSDPWLRDRIWKLRELRDDILWRNKRYRYPSSVHDDNSNFLWAIERVKVRLGDSGNTWWAKGQELEEHDYADDLRLIIRRIEETS